MGEPLFLERLRTLGGKDVRLGGIREWFKQRLRKGQEMKLIRRDINNINISSVSMLAALGAVQEEGSSSADTNQDGFVDLNELRNYFADSYRQLMHKYLGEDVNQDVLIRYLGRSSVAESERSFPLARVK
jgi:hypothetical protein